jgi:Ala-tRNA(Pro) deacylase
MAVNQELKKYLDGNGAKYEIVTHHKVFTTLEESRDLGIEADEIAKCLVIRAKDNRALAVIPGGHRLSNKKVRQAVGSKHARLETEEEMARDFPDFELGAVPPFGEIFNVPVYLDRRLVGRENILFTAGSHTESIRMNCADFINLVKPVIVDLLETDFQ